MIYNVQLINYAVRGIIIHIITTRNVHKFRADALSGHVNLSELKILYIYGDEVIYLTLHYYNT